MKTKQILRDLGFSQSNICVTIIPEGEGTENEQNQYLKR